MTVMTNFFSKKSQIQYTNLNENSNYVRFPKQDLLSRPQFKIHFNYYTIPLINDRYH